MNMTRRSLTAKNALNIFLDLYFYRNIGLRSPTVRFQKIGICICQFIYLFRTAYLLSRSLFGISPINLLWDPPLPYKPTSDATQFFSPHMPPSTQSPPLVGADGKWTLYFDKEDSFSPPPQRE